jgi:enoyl-CoA hydratase/carnithine racemase
MAFELRHIGRVAILTHSAPAMGLDFILEYSARLHEISSDPKNYIGLVVSGTNPKVYNAGLDLNELKRGPYERNNEMI